MCPAVRHFLHFCVNKRTYQFTCLPFGLATSPREFTKLLSPVVCLLCLQGIRLVYLKDWLICAESHIEMDYRGGQDCLFVYQSRAAWEGYSTGISGIGCFVVIYIAHCSGGCAFCGIMEVFWSVPTMLSTGPCPYCWWDELSGTCGCGSAISMCVVANPSFLPTSNPILHVLCIYWSVALMKDYLVYAGIFLVECVGSV